MLHGFATLRADVAVAGVIFNNVGSTRHAQILADAAKAAVPEVVVLGALPHDASLRIESRHLGLRQAEEWDNLEPLLGRLADCLGQGIDLDSLQALARPSRIARAAEAGVPIIPLGQNIAVAKEHHPGLDFICRDVLDLVLVILTWGECQAPCPPACATDVNGDCQVDVQDLTAVIVSWTG